MSNFPSVQFVASPDAGATVLCDLNGDESGASVSTLHDGFSLGMPTLGGEPGDRARSWGATRDGVAIPLLIEGTRADARAALRTIARHATRDGWVRTQLDATAPVIWFRVYASQPEALDWELMMDGAPDRWLTSLPLALSDFGIGASVTIPAVAVTNNPTHASFAVTLPAIEGEMPAPALVKVASSTWMLGPSVAAHTKAATVLALGSWASVAATADAAYIGGQRRETTGSLASWTSVASVARSSGDKGAFRGLLRVSGSTNVGAFQARWSVTAPGSAQAVLTAPVTVPVATMRRWVDTGRLPYPLRDGSALGAAGTTTYTLQVRRVTSGGELRLDDRLLMVPADGSLLTAQTVDAGTGAATVLVDAEERQVTHAVAAGTTPTPDFAGSWPVLRPGETNRLTVLQNLDPTLIATRDDNIAATSTVTLTYRPRYLWGV